LAVQMLSEFGAANCGVMSGCAACVASGSPEGRGSQGLFALKLFRREKTFCGPMLFIMYIAAMSAAIELNKTFAPML
ncbi:MAG: hypothetical protein K2M14_01795, partial [Muribaculaceae bacterium]|nr:hypothetical protein [Muribaculaceae bacterium]